MSPVKNVVSYLYLSSDDDDFVAETVNTRVGNKTRNKRKAADSDDDDVVTLKGDGSGTQTSTGNIPCSLLQEILDNFDHQILHFLFVLRYKTKMESSTVKPLIVNTPD